jgi:hypothetical protein
MTAVPLEAMQGYLMSKVEKFPSEDALRRECGLSRAKWEQIITGTHTDSRVKDKKITEIPIQIADEVAVRLGDHLMDVYPPLYA